MRHIALQDGPQLLPDFRPPLLLDTTGLALPTLVSVLVALQRQALTTLALVAPTDIRLLRLLPLCSAVRVIAADTPDLTCLAPFTRHLYCIQASLPPTSTPAWVGLVPPPDLKPKLAPFLLPALAALQCAPDLKVAAKACAVAANRKISRATLLRLLSSTRTALGMPAGAAARYRPPVLAAAILDALAAS
jgi:hypothetical protein